MLIESTFKPAWWLNNRHLQTIYPALFRKPPLPPEYRRQRITTPDNDFLDIDFCGSGSKPLVLILHGLTGSSKSTYVMGLQSALYGQGIRSAA
ncbi:MAG: alpha/beta hydrolase, partial [Methylobacter sp.]